MTKVKDIINTFFNYLKSLKCKSKCCSGSECSCGDSPTLSDNIQVLNT